MRMLVAAAAAATLVACHEIPQDASKSFAGESETRSYAGARFNGDKAIYEKTLAERADAQNEYLRTGGATSERRK